MSRSESLGLLLAAGLMLLGTSDWKATAQQAVVTQPGKANSGEASSTLASGSLFQRIWASTAGANGAGQAGQRAGCLVLNNSTDRQWVYFQGPGMTAPTAGNFTAIKAVSIPLEAATATNAMGGYVTCATGAGQAVQDSVWIAGTMGDTYVAKQQ